MARKVALLKRKMQILDRFLINLSPIDMLSVLKIKFKLNSLLV